MSGNKSCPRNFGTELTDGFAGRLIRHKAYGIARALRLNQHDQEDLEQSLRLDLLARVDSFDPKRGPWEAFVNVVVVHQAATQYCWLRSQPIPSSMDEDWGGAPMRNRLSENDRSRRLDLYGDQIDADLRMDVAELREQLDLDQQMMLDMLQVWSVSETARELNVPRSTLSDRVNNLRPKFSKLHSETSQKLP